MTLNEKDPHKNLNLNVRGPSRSATIRTKKWARAAAEQVPSHEPLGDDFIRRFCRPALTGVERLCEWLNSLSG
ncbi:MAG: hypothetical protein AB1742_01520 [bacterium]